MTTSSRVPARARVARGAAGILALFVAVEGFTRLEIVDAAYLPYATTLLRRVGELVIDPMFLSEVGWTLVGWLVSLVLAVVVGIVLGTLLARSRVTAALGGVAIGALRPLPAVALVPLASLVWGQGLTMKVVLVTYSALWPVLFNTIAGVRDVDPVALDTARAFGIKRWQVLREIVLPSALPHVFTGVRVAASVAMVVIVGTEVIAGATNGIGAFIIRASASGTDMPSVMAGAVVAGILGLAINQGLSAVEDRWLGWARREVTA